MASVAQLIYPGGSYARAINDNGDVVFEAGRGFLYTDATKTITINGIPTQVRYGTNGNGVVPLDSLVVTDGWLDTSARLDGINNRVGDNPDSDGFGHICGYDYGSSRGFLLTPIGPAH
jgi:hypothetical protein